MRNSLAWLLGLEDFSSIDDAAITLSADWAQGAGHFFWALLGLALACAAGITFYLKWQPAGARSVRVLLGISRGLLLSLLILTLAEPVITVTTAQLRSPLVYVLFDGTASMAIADCVVPTTAPSAATNATRLDLVRNTLVQDPNNFLRQLQQQKTRLEVFQFAGNSTSSLRKLRLQSDNQTGFDPATVARQLSANGQVTAIGAALHDVTRQLGSGELDALIVVSDFGHNTGVMPLSAGSPAQRSPAARLGIPVYTVGVGEPAAVDLAVSLQTEPKIRRGEQTLLRASIRQNGLSGQPARLRLTARPQTSRSVDEQTAVVAELELTLDDATTLAEFPWLPQRAGEFVFNLSVEPLAGEVLTENNQAIRRANIIDDFVRLMYVAHEPTWEWRFVKEVFHRDKAVGLRGFRTYLASSDPLVRGSNPLFLQTLTPPREAFFANDVLFLDDVPGSMLSPRFAAMLREFVGNLGGGLVVIAGPRFGPQELAGSTLEELLPVTIDPNLQRVDQPFELQLTAATRDGRYPFMQLGENETETRKSWRGLGQLPWYQPVQGVHSLADVLAEHPTDRCANGEDKQPLIAIRRYGEGEVVYLGFNETWRLRRQRGERYYRSFWGTLIDRLGISHALGARKRFVAKLDTPQHRYTMGDSVTLSVQAYDQNYEPLDKDTSLQAELVLPAASGQPTGRQITLAMIRPGLFETQFPVFLRGQHQLRIQDPITSEQTELDFDVRQTSAERRGTVRDVGLQQELARQTGGRSYTLDQSTTLATDMALKPRQITASQQRLLWTTPVWFLTVVSLMLGEWLTRKLLRFT
ncbi:MAG: hypothetical protein CMJ75_00755 [Planctomycetaceae bacterium]|nr:hypothetical protein [Planctomycetaceae bacterium]